MLLAVSCGPAGSPEEAYDEGQQALRQKDYPGAIAAFAAWPVAAFLPIIGLPTALIFGLGVGWGVHHGSRDAQKRLPPA